MGLDMYLGRSKPNDQGEPQNELIHQWRKHNALHGWMTDLAIKRGRVTDPYDFNCCQLPLTSEDLDVLETAIRHYGLTPTEGFFFGSTSYSQDDWNWHQEDDLDAVAKARAAINDGYTVFYDSWW